MVTATTHEKVEDDDKDKLEDSTIKPVVSESGQISPGVGGASVSSPTQAVSDQGSGQYTNVADYADANKERAGQIQGRILGDIEARRDKIDSDLSKQQTGFQNRLSPEQERLNNAGQYRSDILGRAGKGLSDDDFKGFSNLRQGKGKFNQFQAPQYGGFESRGDSLKRGVEGFRRPGRFTSLLDNKGYNSGSRALDEAVLSRTPGVAQNIRQESEGLIHGLPERITKQRKEESGKLRDLRNQARNVSRETEADVAKSRADFDAMMQGKVEDRQTEALLPLYERFYNQGPDSDRALDIINEGNRTRRQDTDIQQTAEAKEDLIRYLAGGGDANTYLQGFNDPWSRAYGSSYNPAQGLRRQRASDIERLLSPEGFISNTDINKFNVADEGDFSRVNALSRLAGMGSNTPGYSKDLLGTAPGAGDPRFSEGSYETYLDRLILGEMQEGETRNNFLKNQEALTGKLGSDYMHALGIGGNFRNPEFDYRQMVSGTGTMDASIGLANYGAGTLNNINAEGEEQFGSLKGLGTTDYTRGDMGENIAGWKSDIITGNGAIRGDTGKWLDTAAKLGYDSTIGVPLQITHTLAGAGGQALSKTGAEAQRVVHRAEAATRKAANDAWNAAQNASGSVICKELQRQGFIDALTYKKDKETGLYYLENDPAVYYGYLSWAQYVVKGMRKSKIITNIVKPFGLAWANDMAGKKNWLGATLNKIGVPLCRLIGKSLMKFGMFSNNNIINKEQRG